MKIYKLLAAALVLVALAHAAQALLHRWYNRGSAEQLSFKIDFEDGTASLWEELGAIQVCCDDSLQVVTEPVRNGEYSARFHLRNDDSAVKGSRRAEVRMKAGPFETEYRYRFSIFLPEAWNDPEVPATLAQWHAVPDKLFGEAGRSPPLRLMALAGQWQIASIWDADRVSQTLFSDNDPDGSLLTSLGPLTVGEWADWEFRVRWSFASDGLLEVWLNGQRVFERSGPNAYNDALAPYLKLGIYVPAWAASRSTEQTEFTSFVDEVEVSIRSDGQEGISAGL